MDERIQAYETKMGKTLNALESELTTPISNDASAMVTIP